MDDFLDHLHGQSSPNEAPGTVEPVLTEETTVIAQPPVRSKTVRPPKLISGDRDVFVQRILMVPPGYASCEKRIPLSKRADRILNLLAQEADYLNTHATKQQILDNLLQFVFEQHHDILIQLYKEQKMRTDQETGFEL